MIESTAVMIKKAHDALPRAYAPYSNYQVASCVQAEDGSLFTGVNVENAAYGMAICAESSAICQMIAAGHRKIHSIVVLNGRGDLCAPCGGCRQRIAEFAEADTLIHLCNHQEIIKTFHIDELLPFQFKL